MKPRIDDSMAIDWGLTAGDYAAFRPGPPDDFYQKLAVLGVGLRGQRVLDLATGTGVIARNLAKRGAIVIGIDIAQMSLDVAKKLAQAEGLDIGFVLSPVEDPPFLNNSFDVATANQCFLYFDTEKTLATLRRILRHNGALMISHFSWLPLNDPIAAMTEKLILDYNPNWQGAGFDGKIQVVPHWLPSDMMLESYFTYDVDIPFDRTTWRGRVRASRGIGASQNADVVARFDAELDKKLQQNHPSRFTIKHRVDARVLRFL